MTYEQAIKRLEEIVTGLESGTLELEKFTEYMAEAKRKSERERYFTRVSLFLCMIGTIT